MPLPPARYSSRNFTLAYEPTREVALVHGIWRRHERFWLIGYGQQKVNSNAIDFDESLADAMLLARELDGVPLASWELYEPPAGVKLFIATDPRWVRRRHRRARQDFLWLRYPVRPSRRHQLARARAPQQGSAASPGAEPTTVLKGINLMQPGPSVHDNFVYGYSVDCESQRLILHTAYRDREPHEFTDVVFHDVVAHHCEHVLPGNILLGVDEVDVAALVRENGRVLAESWRYGWPPVEYRGDLEALVAALRAAGVRGYEISASYGMSGWVLAGSCERLRRDEAVRVR